MLSSGFCCTVSAQELELHFNFEMLVLSLPFLLPAPQSFSVDTDDPQCREWGWVPSWRSREQGHLHLEVWKGALLQKDAQITLARSPQGMTSFKDTHRLWSNSSNEWIRFTGVPVGLR